MFGHVVTSKSDSDNRCKVLFVSEADTATDDCGGYSNEILRLSVDKDVDIRQIANRPSLSQSIVDIVQTCFEGLSDPVQSYKARSLTLQNYQIATKLLRSALTADPTDRGLAAPIGALALYEVRCEPIVSRLCSG